MEGIWFAESTLETGCNAGAPKSTRAPREYPQKMSSLSATAAAGCERHQLRTKLKSLSSFYLVTLKSEVLTSTRREDLLT